MKRNYCKTTAETARHPIWVEEETGMEMTAIHWRIWAREKGLLTEKEGRDLFLVVNGFGKTIKTLVRKDSLN